MCLDELDLVLPLDDLARLLTRLPTQPSRPLSMLDGTRLVAVGQALELLLFFPKSPLGSIALVQEMLYVFRRCLDVCLGTFKPIQDLLHLQYLILQPVVLASKELWSSGRPCIKLVKETNGRREVVKLGGTAGVWSPVPTVKCRWINDGFDLLFYFVEWFSAVFEFNSCILA